MSTWIMEPGHTEAELKARHMMVTWVRGLFKDMPGTLELDRDQRLAATFEGCDQAPRRPSHERPCTRPCELISTRVDDVDATIRDRLTEAYLHAE